MAELLIQTLTAESQASFRTVQINDENICLQTQTQMAELLIQHRWLNLKQVSEQFKIMMYNNENMKVTNG